MSRCYECMREYGEEYDICPHCGCEKEVAPKEMYYLKPGTVLGERYEVGIAVGAGGFGITYKAWDRTLEKIVAIKEYYPTGLVNRIPGEEKVIIYSGSMQREFIKGKERFVEEAKNTAQYNTHPNIVNVFAFFEENNTAYMVMEYLDGINYKEYIKEHGGKIEVEEALIVTKAILNALSDVHKNNIIHRDISPDNIYICKDGKIKLIDFGAAKFSAEGEVRTRSIILKHGFAPPEQYQTRSNQGPWTDIYALGATLYRAITGIVPEESSNRVKEDTLIAPKELCPEISDNINNAILRSMALLSALRYQNADEFLKALNTTAKVRDVKKELQKRKIQRVLSIAIAGIMVLGVIGLCVGVLDRKKEAAAVLDEAEISIWVSVEADSNIDLEKKVMEAALGEFQSEYPQIEVSVSYLEADVYEAKLQTAIEAEKLPTLFESSSLDNEYFTYMEDVTKVFDYIKTDDYYFFGEYQKYFPQQKQMPLGFSVPLIYRNTIMEADSGVEQLIVAGNYGVTAKNYLTWYNLYSGNSKIEDVKHGLEVLKSLDDEVLCHNALEQFVNKEKACLIGDISDYGMIQKNMAGIYEIQALDNDLIVGCFQDCFSISKDASESEQEAAVQVLVYLLADNAQDIKYVQNGDCMPVNRAVYDSYMAINTELADLEYDLDKIFFAGEYQSQLDKLYEEQ